MELVKHGRVSVISVEVKGKNGLIMFMTKYDLEKLIKPTSKDYAKRYIRVINGRNYWPYYATTTKEEAKKVKQRAKDKHYLSYISPVSDFVKDKHKDAKYIVWVTPKWKVK